MSSLAAMRGSMHSPARLLRRTLRQQRDVGAMLTQFKPSISLSTQQLGAGEVYYSSQPWEDLDNSTLSEDRSDVEKTCNCDVFPARVPKLWNFLNTSYHQCARFYSTLSGRHNQIHQKYLRKKNVLPMSESLLTSAATRDILESRSCHQLADYTTVGEALKCWTQNLKDAQVPEPRLSIEHIISHVVGVPRAMLGGMMDYPLTDDQTIELERLATCRVTRVPVQYIIGEWDFYGLTLRLQPPVFIPRRETEGLVTLALERLEGMTKPKVLDLCTGSGALLLAILVKCKQAEGIGLDQSENAVDLALDNSHILNVRERFRVFQHKLEADSELPEFPFKQFDLIVANPPYILRKDLMTVEPEIMLYEDLRALDGGADGLNVIKPLLKHAAPLLAPEASLILEVDPCHAYLLPEWLNSEEGSDVPLEVVMVHKDFAEKDRFLELKKINYHKS